jgi:ATP-dependent DNA helicase RecG
VGRGEHPSYCLLFADSSSADAAERLQAIAATTDGFELAQRDLEMRGPGEFLGVRQSGFPELRFARVSDLRMIEAVRDAARRFCEQDPGLALPDSRLLARQVAQLWSRYMERREETGEGDVS